MINKKGLILIATAIIAVAALVLYYLSHTNDAHTTDVRKGRIAGIKTMTQLCAIDIYSEVPVLDTINNKVIFAIQKQKGSVSFDLENMQIDTEGDTIRIMLPPEIVEFYEATDDNSWEVVDTKAIGAMSMFRSNKFTIEEENAVKANIKKRSTRQLYHNGTIERARAEGTVNLQRLMETVYRKPVIVSDPTPRGARFDDYR